MLTCFDAFQHAGLWGWEGSIVSIRNHFLSDHLLSKHPFLPSSPLWPKTRPNCVKINSSNQVNVKHIISDGKRRCKVWLLLLNRFSNIPQVIAFNVVLVDYRETFNDGGTVISSFLWIPICLEVGHVVCWAPTREDTACYYQNHHNRTGVLTALCGLYMASFVHKQWNPHRAEPFGVHHHRGNESDHSYPSTFCEICNEDMAMYSAGLIFIVTFLKII